MNQSINNFIFSSPTTRRAVTKITAIKSEIIFKTVAVHLFAGK